MDKHTTQYKLAVGFIKDGIDEEKACRLAVEVEELIEKGILEIEEKIYKLLEYRGVMKAKEGEQNG